MADLEPIAIRVSDRLRNTLARVNRLALGIATVTAAIGVATFATGLWIFDGSRPTWIVLGGIICLIPTIAAVRAWFYVHSTVKVAPRLAGDVRTLMGESNDSAKVLLDYDTGEPLANTARSFGNLRLDLARRRKELPALYSGIRAITLVPGLAAIALLGTLAVGALGTILLIGGLID